VKTGREPLRRCVVCRAVRPKRELLRVVRDPGGGLRVDESGGAPGRGAYACPEHAGLPAARTGVSRSLHGALPETQAARLGELGRMTAGRRTSEDVRGT